MANGTPRRPASRPAAPPSHRRGSRNSEALVRAGLGPDATAATTPAIHRAKLAANRLATVGVRPRPPQTGTTGSWCPTHSWAGDGTAGHWCEITSSHPPPREYFPARRSACLAVRSPLFGPGPRPSERAARNRVFSAPPPRADCIAARIQHELRRAAAPNRPRNRPALAARDDHGPRRVGVLAESPAGFPVATPVQRTAAGDAISHRIRFRGCEFERAP